MVYITGDTHGDFTRFQSPILKKATAHDYLIVCGDFGFFWDDSKKEQKIRRKIEELNYTVCVVDGCHENYDLLEKFPTQEWNGGTARVIAPNLVHLMRGQVFEIDGKTFFTMGGAYSIDKGSRTPGYSWWPDELPTDADYKEATSNLQKYGMKVDYIITHTLPREMILRLGKYPDAHDMELTGFLEWIMYEVDFKHWYCGHWHDDKELNDQFTILWFDVKEL